MYPYNSSIGADKRHTSKIISNTDKRFHRPSGLKNLKSCRVEPLLFIAILFIFCFHATYAKSFAPFSLSPKYVKGSMIQRSNYGPQYNLDMPDSVYVHDDGANSDFENTKGVTDDASTEHNKRSVSLLGMNY